MAKRAAILAMLVVFPTPVGPNRATALPGLSLSGFRNQDQCGRSTEFISETVVFVFSLRDVITLNEWEFELLKKRNAFYRSDHLIAGRLNLR